MIIAVSLKSNSENITQTFKHGIGKHITIRYVCSIVWYYNSYIHFIVVTQRPIVVRIDEMISGFEKALNNQLLSTKFFCSKHLVVSATAQSPIDVITAAGCQNINVELLLLLRLGE